MEKSEKEYLIGLDVGVGSAGFAVTDGNYKLINKKGKKVWGVRLFDEAKTAEERRKFRSNRRRLQKRNWRLMLLKQELKKFVDDEDPGFLARLRDSKLVKGEKTNVFFNDEKYKDRNYFIEFPTVYHLRESLKKIELCRKYEKEGKYMRFLFLSINDILKNRGNFLTAGTIKDSDEKLTITTIRDQIEQFLFEIADTDEVFFDNEKVIKSFDDHMNHIKLNLRGQDKNTALIKLLIGGYSVNLNKIFDIEAEEKIDISFDDEYWEEKIPNNGVISSYLPTLFMIYSNIKIYNLIGSSGSFSAAKVNVYESHQKQLKSLKNDIKKIDSKLGTSHYYHLFLDKSEEDKDKNGSYTHYVGKYLESGQKIRTKKKTTYEQLIKDLKKIKKDYVTLTLDENVLVDLDNENFLKIPIDKDNRLIPFQIHLQELRQILGNFRTITKNRGIDEKIVDQIVDRVEKLLTFKVPYFVGPLSNKNNSSLESNYWLCKRKDVNVTPYNFDDVVSKEESNKAFIKKMLRSCTYLHSQNCVQQETIIYQSYIFYNTLNKMKANDKYLNKLQKDVLFNNAVSGKKLTKKSIIKMLGLPADTDLNSFAKDSEKEINISLSAIAKFNKIFPNFSENKLYQSFFDHVINELSLIDKDESEIRKIIIKRIVEKFKTITIDDDQIEELSRLTSKKWGNLSEKFLSELMFVNPTTGELGTIMSILKDSNLNIMEILYDANNYNINIIDRENDDVDDLNQEGALHLYLKKRYVSPQARRAIVQTVRIVDEIVDVMGCIPKRIAIEFTREKDRNPRETNSRFRQLKSIYENLKNEQDMMSKLGQLENDQSKLNAKKIYLYFLQGGKDIYTGDNIDFDQLMTSDHIYDIDHIFPQSKIKDDSLDNLVLTSSVENSKKGNKYPINPDIRKNRSEQWKQLKDRGLMSSKKYDRLVRGSELTKDELIDFVNRQKTTLDWINLELAEILSRKYGKEKNEFIIFSKSRHISDFRNENGLVKFRDLNNIHHAHDAYLNIAVGNTIKNYSFVTLDDGEETNNIKTFTNYYLKNIKEYINKIFQFPNVLITKKTTINSTGAFWDQMQVGKKAGLIEIKMGYETEIYGGYRGARVAFFSIVMNEKNMKQIIPIYTVDCGNFYDGNDFNLFKFKQFMAEKGYSTLLYPILPIQAKITMDGVPFRIAGKSNNSILLHNCSEFTIDLETISYLKAILKYHEKLKKKLKKADINDIDYLVNKNFTKEDNVKTFIKIRNKVKEIKYSSNTFSRVLDENGEKIEAFKLMSFYDQAETFKIIVNNLLRSNASNQGKLFGKAYTDLQIAQTIKTSFSVIKESITGLFVKEVVINEVSDSSDKKSV